MPNVLLSTNTMGAEIRYTTDGNDVTEDSTLYSGQFSVEAGATVKAKAFKAGMNPSPQSELASFQKLQTPTLSLSRSGSVINITLGNTVEGATYRYKVGSAPTSPTDGTAITGSATLDNSSALTIYVVGWKTGTYNPSDTAMDSVEQYVPTLQTPTLSLTRDGSTVNGTIGNTVSGATYVYKIGSSPSSQSDGTVISGTTFSFSNSDAVTVYVRGFMSGYNPSNAVSKSVRGVVPVTVPMALPDGSVIFYDRGASYGEYHIDDTGYPVRNDGSVDDGTAVSLNWRYLICDSANLSEMREWGPRGTDEGLTGTIVGYGLPNTEAMLSKYSDNSTYLWQLVQNKRNATGGKKWFVPSKDELNIVYQNKGTIISAGGGSFPTSEYYESSSEATNINGRWTQNFSTGDQYYSAKNLTNYCRLLRRI